MKTNLTSAFLLTIATLTIGLSGCHKAVTVTSDDEVPRIVSKEIPIGVVVALTGHHAEPYGLPMQRGFELAREEINNLGDVRLAFITVDDMSTPDGAKAAVRHLVNQKVPAISWACHLDTPQGGGSNCAGEQGHSFQFRLLRRRIGRDRGFCLPHQSRHEYKHSQRCAGDSGATRL